MKKNRALGTDGGESKCLCLQLQLSRKQLALDVSELWMLQEPSSGAIGTLGAAGQAMDGLRGGHMPGQLAVGETTEMDLLSGSHACLPRPPGLLGLCPV